MPSGVRTTLRRLEREVEAWRTEPLKAVAARARVMRPIQVRRFHRFGEGSIVDRPTWLYGSHQMALGDSSVVLRGCWLAVERVAWDRPAPVLSIGHRVWMRMSCTLSAAESIEIEDDVVFGSLATVIDSDHTWAGGRPNVLDNPVKTSPVRIGRGTWIADRAAVLRGSDIGEQCLIGANAVVRGVIPDHSIAVGAPARVVGHTR